MAFSNYIWKPFQILLIDRCQPFDAICFAWIDWPTSQETNMAEYMESNVTLMRNLIEDNKTYKHVSEILRQNFPEVTRGFSERNVRLFCAKYGIRRLNEYEVDSIVQKWKKAPTKQNSYYDNPLSLDLKEKKTSLLFVVDRRRIWYIFFRRLKWFDFSYRTFFKSSLHA